MPIGGGMHVLTWRPLDTAGPGQPHYLCRTAGRSAAAQTKLASLLMPSQARFDAKSRMLKCWQMRVTCYSWPLSSFVIVMW